ANGTPAPTFQWLKNGATLAGATSATLNLTNVQAGDAANYSVVATNSAGSATSNVASLTLNVAPALTQQPAAVTVTVGATATFTVTATGSPAPAYQWLKNGANIAGATTATLTLTNVQTADAANYTVVVSNSAGSAISNAAALVVNQPGVAPAI